MTLNLMFKEICWNLDMLNKVDDHETFNVLANELHIDKRSFQFVRRAFSSDDRLQICEAVENTLTKIQELLTTYYFITDKVVLQECYKQIEKMKMKLLGADIGLTKIGKFERYKNDADFQVRIDKCRQTKDELIVKCVKPLGLQELHEPELED